METDILAGMISVGQALEIIRWQTPAPQPCRVPLRAAAGRILAQDVASDMLLPPFDRATMDGYAFRSQDALAPDTALRLIGESAAGHGFSGVVGPGEAVQIMTGAPVPAGADCVQMIEKTFQRGEQVVIREAADKGKNIAAAGCEIGPEDALRAGRHIGAAELAVLAAFGAATVPVFRPPRIALMVTGDELVEAINHPGPNQIRNSNAYSLQEQICSCGIEPVYLGIAGDEKSALEEKLLQAVTHDIALVTGGVSMGKYDRVGQVLREAGAVVHFDKVAIKPGKPLTFATCQGRLFFGLPGNPVSSFVTFEVFVRPVIARLMGKSGRQVEVRARMKHSVLNQGPRDYYAPARTRWNGRHWETEALKTRGSADIFRFSEADSLAMFPAGSNLGPGTEQTVLLLSDYWERIQAS